MSNPTVELVLGVLIILVIFGAPFAMYLLPTQYHDRAWEKRVDAAEAHAYRVTGKVARFGTTSADEDSVEYSFQLEADSTAYRVGSAFMVKGSNGELTSPGDLVTFRVLPGLLSVRDFYNAAAARA